MPPTDAAQRALALAYRYLNSRERSSGELRRHLLARVEDEVAVEATLAELTDLGYLDDARYARLFTEDRRRLDGWGRERIRRTLLERGLEREVIEQALGPEDPEEESERALELLRRRHRVPPRTRAERDRALGMLMRRGFGTEVALAAISRAGREAAA